MPENRAIRDDCYRQIMSIMQNTKERVSSLLGKTYLCIVCFGYYYYVPVLISS